LILPISGIEVFVPIPVSIVRGLVNKPMMRIILGVPMRIADYSILNALQFHINLFPENEISTSSDKANDWVSFWRWIRNGHGCVLPFDLCCKDFAY
jgi:hypothetical protein